MISSSSSIFRFWHSIVLQIKGDLKWLFYGALILFAASLYLKRALPEQSEIDASLIRSPIQTATKRAPFTADFKGKEYRITPKFDYELWGLIVSARDLKGTWYNVDYKRDPMNLKDLCVIWGGNLLSNDYRKISFSSGLWTCYVQFRGNITFIPQALSNNHILPGTKEVADLLAKSDRGDQIHFKGVLADYSVEGRGGERKTSISRGDMGNGACEVVYADNFEIIKEESPILKFIHTSSRWAIAFCILFWLYYHLIHPGHKFENCYQKQ